MRKNKTLQAGKVRAAHALGKLIFCVKVIYFLFFCRLVKDARLHMCDTRSLKCPRHRYLLYSLYSLYLYKKALTLLALLVQKYKY